MEYYFTAQKLAVGYDNRPLIENIDFSLKRGEILTLIGPNGAGKSTILKSIAIILFYVIILVATKSRAQKVLLFIFEGGIKDGC